MACSFFERVYAMEAVDQFANIYLCREFVDFRKSINGLSAIVAGDLSLDLKKSALFIFLFVLSSGFKFSRCSTLDQIISGKNVQFRHNFRDI
jgi:hypothetical protein